MKRFRAAQRTQVALEQYQISTMLTVPVMITAAEGRLSLTATVVVLAYREGTDWQTEPAWQRRARAGEVAVTVGPAPMIIGTAHTDANGEIAMSMVVPNGTIRILAHHLASGTAVVRYFEVVDGVVLVGSLTEQQVTNEGNPMPVTFNQAVLGHPAAQAYDSMPRVKWTGRGWDV